jgi:hypothetical protein
VCAASLPWLFLTCQVWTVVLFTAQGSDSTWTSFRSGLNGGMKQASWLTVGSVGTGLLTLHIRVFFLHKRNPIVAADTLMHSLIRHKIVAAARPYFTEPYHHLWHGYLLLATMPNDQDTAPHTLKTGCTNNSITSSTWSRLKFILHIIFPCLNPTHTCTSMFDHSIDGISRSRILNSQHNNSTAGNRESVEVWFST